MKQTEWSDCTATEIAVQDELVRKNLPYLLKRAREEFVAERIAQYEESLELPPSGSSSDFYLKHLQWYYGLRHLSKQTPAYWRGLRDLERVQRLHGVTHLRPFEFC